MLKLRPIYCPNVILLDSGDDHIFPMEEAKSIIAKLKQASKLITVYINHDIADLDESQIVVKYDDYSIYKEIRTKGKSITSEFLAAGSNYVYYIKTDLDSYRAAFIHIFDILSGDYPIICVSKNFLSQMESAAVVVLNDIDIDHKNALEITTQPQTPLFTTRELLLQNLSFVDNKIIISN